MITRLKYKKADCALVSNKIIIGVESYHVEIDDLWNEVWIIGDKSEFTAGLFNTKAKAKKAAKEKLIEMGAVFALETRRKKTKPSPVTVL